MAVFITACLDLPTIFKIPIFLVGIIDGSRELPTSNNGSVIFHKKSYMDIILYGCESNRRINKFKPNLVMNGVSAIKDAPPCETKRKQTQKYYANRNLAVTKIIFLILF